MEAVVRVIDDHFAEIIFVAIQGRGRSEVEAVIRKEVETLDRKAIDALLKSERPKDRATGIRILAAVAPDVADPQIVSAFSAAAKDSAPEVLHALVDAVSRAAWPELWPVVEELASTGMPEAQDLRKAAQAHLPRAR
jgi:hypothetical protein